MSETETASQKVGLGKKTGGPITLTDAAQSKLAQLLAAEVQDKPMALRIAVRPGGCSGFSYEMYFDTDKNLDDIEATFSDGAVRVWVDEQSAEKLHGAELDYKDSLQGAGFHITNPNASRTCGCGSSFS